MVSGAGKDGPAPFGERLRCGGRGRGGVSLVEALVRLERRPLEADGVDLLGLDVEQVAGRTRDEQPARERAPEPGDMHLDRVLRLARRGVAPEIGDERRRRDEPAGPEQKQAEHGLLPRRSEIQLLSVGRDGKRPQDPEAERCLDRGQAPNVPRVLGGIGRFGHAESG